MVKKKGQKNTQSKKKLDLAAAVEAAEQEEDENDLSKLNLNDDDSLAASVGKTDNGDSNDAETATGNEGEEEAVLMNYNPPEEGPTTAGAGKLLTAITLSTRYT